MQFLVDKVKTKRNYLPEGVVVVVVVAAVVAVGARINTSSSNSV